MKNNTIKTTKNTETRVSPLLAATEKAARRITNKILLLSTFGSKGNGTNAEKMRAQINAAPNDCRKAEKEFHLRQSAQKAQAPRQLDHLKEEIFEEARAGLHSAIAKNNCLGCKLMILKQFSEKRALYAEGFRLGQSVFRKMSRKNALCAPEDVSEMEIAAREPFFECKPETDHFSRAIEFFGKFGTNRKSKVLSQKFAEWMKNPPAVTPRRCDLEQFRNAMIFGLVGIGFAERTAENMLPILLDRRGGLNASTI